VAVPVYVLVPVAVAIEITGVVVVDMKHPPQIKGGGG
jgi:hypothetical protein